MIKNESEIWRALLGIPGIEVSTLGNIRTLDRVISSEKMTCFKKGRVLKQRGNNYGYLLVNIPIAGKQVTKLVHRLVAQIFLPNTDNLPEVNHKDGNRMNNNVSNLEWCSHSYNMKYREKFGISNTESLGVPVFAINLTTLKVSKYRSQKDASRALGVYQANINKVIKGRRNHTGGFWFTNDDNNADDTIKQKLYEIKHRSILKVH